MFSSIAPELFRALQFELQSSIKMTGLNNFITSPHTYCPIFRVLSPPGSMLSVTNPIKPNGARNDNNLV